MTCPVQIGYSSGMDNVMLALKSAANKLADTMFIYGATMLEVDDQGGIFATVEEFDGTQKRVYLFDEVVTGSHG